MSNPFNCELSVIITKEYKKTRLVRRTIINNFPSSKWNSDRYYSFYLNAKFIIYYYSFRFPRIVHL